MNNMHQPPEGDPQDYWPTQDLGSADPGRAAGQPGQGPGWGQPTGQPGWPGQPPAGPAGPAGPSGPTGPGNQADPPRRHGRAMWWGAGFALVALLGGGIAAAELSSSASPAPSGPTGQAAVLNSMLSSASSPASAAAAGSSGTSASTTASPAAKKNCQTRVARLKAAGHPVAAQAAQRFCGHPLRRIRVLGGIHGQFTFETKSGPRTLAYERGVIKSISGSDVVVQAKDGTTWTWVLESNTAVRQDGKKASTSALASGERVFAGGPVVSGGYDARLIVVRPSSSSSPSPAPSSSPSSSSSS